MTRLATRLLLCAVSLPWPRSTAAETASVALEFLSYFGGPTAEEENRELRIDPQGHLLMTGYGAPDPADYPEATVIGPVNDGTRSTYVARFSADGRRLLQLAIIGGNGKERGYGLEVDADGYVYVAGRTSSTDLPVTDGSANVSDGGCGHVHGDRQVGFVLRLTPELALDWWIYVGGSGCGGFRGGLTLGPHSLYAMGETTSRDWRGAMNAYTGGGSEGVISRISLEGQLLGSRYVGSATGRIDNVIGGAVYGGDLYVQAMVSGPLTGEGGRAGEAALITADAYDATYNGGEDTYLARLSADLRQVYYGTYLGGSGDEWAEHNLHVDATGITLAGVTASDDFPTTRGRADGSGYLVKLLPGLGSSQLLLSTRIGGDAYGLDVAADGRIYVSGQTDGSSFVTTADALQSSYGGGPADGYLRVHSATGDLLYGTFLGGAGYERTRTVQVTGDTVFVAGVTTSDDLPTTADALQAHSSGTEDVFLARFAVEPRGDRVYHVATTGDDAAAGTLSAPLRTIQRAVDRAGAGDTVLVHAGVYREAVVLRDSGEPGRPVVLRGAPGEMAVIQPGDEHGVDGPDKGVLLQNRDGYRLPIGWIVIEGFEIRWAYDGIKMYNAHDVVIRGNHIRHSFNQGILGNGSRVWIDANRIAHNGTNLAERENLQHGIYTTGSAFTITNNVFHSNRAYGVQVAAYSFRDGHAAPEFSDARDWLIANNTFAFSQHRAGIVVWMAGVQNLVVQNNIFYRNGGVNGVLFYDQKGKGHRVRNNLFFPPGGLTEFGEGSYEESGSLEADPMFVDPDAFDFRLRPDSPAIDAGLGEGAPDHDLSGQVRPLGTSVDIGAYESVPPRDSGVPSVVESGTSLSLPVAPELLGNYPNPFNPTTRIRMLLPSDGPARLDLYDLTGQRLRTLLHESAPRGLYEVVWDGRDDAGTAVGSGVYIARLQTGQRSASMAMALIR